MPARTHQLGRCSVRPADASWEDHVLPHGGKWGCGAAACLPLNGNTQPSKPTAATSKQSFIQRVRAFCFFQRNDRSCSLAQKRQVGLEERSHSGPDLPAEEGSSFSLSSCSEGLQIPHAEGRVWEQQGKPGTGGFGGSRQ